MLLEWLRNAASPPGSSTDRFAQAAAALGLSARAQRRPSARRSAPPGQPSPAVLHCLPRYSASAACRLAAVASFVPAAAACSRPRRCLTPSLPAADQAARVGPVVVEEQLPPPGRRGGGPPLPSPATAVRTSMRTASVSHTPLFQRTLIQRAIPQLNAAHACAGTAGGARGGAAVSGGRIGLGGRVGGGRHQPAPGCHGEPKSADSKSLRMVGACLSFVCRRSTHSRLRVSAGGRPDCLRPADRRPGRFLHGVGRLGLRAD